MMREGGSFENSQENLESQQHERFVNETEYVFRSIERQRKILERPFTPEQSEIISKILLKLDLKRNLKEANLHADDLKVYQPMKKLGVLLVFDRKANVPWIGTDGFFEIGIGDAYMDVHLPPVSKEGRGDLFTQTRRSFELLAGYIQEQKLEPKYIMGVTYEKLAKAARRYGFKTMALDIPEDFRAGVEQVYAQFRDSKSDEIMGDILLCYQTKEEFLKRFGEKQ